MDLYILNNSIEELETHLYELKSIRDNIEFQVRNPTNEIRWYNIDIGMHYIVSQGLPYQSDIFFIESNSFNRFSNYYLNNFEIEFNYEQELALRLEMVSNNTYTIVDPSVKEYSISPNDIKKYKYRHLKYRICSNNKQLFESLILIFDIKNSYIIREYFEWFNTEIKQYLPFDPSIINATRVESVKIMGYDVYYSVFHKLWGFNEKQFKYIYMLEVGHSIEIEEILLGRLNRRKSMLYVNLDPNIAKLDQLGKLFIKRFKFIDHNLRIVANSKTIFESYSRAIKDRYNTSK